MHKYEFVPQHTQLHIVGLEDLRHLNLEKPGWFMSKVEVAELEIYAWFATFKHDYLEEGIQMVNYWPLR